MAVISYQSTPGSRNVWQLDTVNMTRELWSFGTPERVEQGGKLMKSVTLAADEMIEELAQVARLKSSIDIDCFLDQVGSKV